ncbi:MAG TPA: CotH kinase family protein [Candidatus Mediterraneibacter cottocaccae]|nr:CotH kinase family protein [Candidatus Mediterraneibacter cottocaccae]
MKRNRLIYAGVTVCVLCAAVLFTVLDGGEDTVRYHQHLEQPDESELGEKPESDGLVTHLPIIEIDTTKDGVYQKIPGKAIMDEQQNAVIGEETGENGETEITARLRTIEAEGEWHDSEGEADNESDILIHIRGNSSRAFDKSNYRIKLTGDNDPLQKRSLPLLGMEKSADWVLHGPFLDKTLIRNYMWMNISAEIMGYAPNVRFCELILNEKYMGVYVLMETIEVSESRVDLTQYEAGDPVMSYMIHIEPKAELDRSVETFSFYAKKLEPERQIEIAYPGRQDLTREVKEYIQADFSEIEKAIYSDEAGSDPDFYLEYLDDTFYNAFFEFNKDGEEPLYLLQGILIQDAVNYGTGDAYESDYMGQLQEDGRQMIDVIHGNRLIMGSVPGKGSGWYTKDISEWVIGFLVGSEWSGNTVAYTDHETTHKGVYNGTYFTAGSEAGPFEAMLARVMDEITEYESSKYKEQHLIGFANSPATDPLEYRDDYGELREKYAYSGTTGVTYARQLDKICQIDAEHIRTTDKMKAGYFAAYSLYDFCEDFYRYLSEEQTTELADILEEIDREGSYDGYAELLGKYHTVPVVCTSYGFTTARGVVSEKGFPLTEAEQGERLVEIYEDLCSTGWSGAVINAWQDRWELRSWNTAYAQDFTNNALWHDIQTEAQGYGLMEFSAESRMTDGDPGEWGKKDIVCENNGFTLSAYADDEGLVLLVEGDGISPENPLYIPVDTTDKSGSSTSRTPQLSFSRPADFLICIDGEENSRIMVQERYESVRANFLQEINGEDAYISFPSADSDVFLPINMVMENTTIVDYVDYTNRGLKYLPVYETGKLRHGNGNPEAEDYDSLADFCFGDDCVELRIPWALLNVANPADMLIHDDYYENYGVDFIRADSFWLGIAADAGEETEMHEFPLKWEEKTYTERVKQSYDIVRAAWR